MSLTLDLPEDLENELSTEAAKLGLSLPEYVLRVYLQARVFVTSRGPVQSWLSTGMLKV